MSEVSTAINGEIHENKMFENIQVPPLDCVKSLRMQFSMVICSDLKFFINKFFLIKKYKQKYFLPPISFDQCQ
jgi:hypothetical protein